MKFQSDSSARRIVKNGGFTAIRFAVYTLSGVVFIPFLVRQYGSGTYGLIALAGFLTQYVGLISRCVGNAIARFLNVALNQDDWKQANEIFSTALVANAGFILLQIPLFVFGVWKLDWLIEFPADIGFDFRILVICNIISFCIALLTGIFQTPIQAANRLDISSTVDSVSIILRLVLLFTLIITVGAKLWLIGVVDLGLSIGKSVITYVMYRKLARDLVFKWKYVTRTWVRPVVNMAGWSIVTALGGCLFLKTDIWMINRFVSKETAGIYAALLVWPNFLRQISKQLASILAPVYMIDFAKGDLARVARLSLSSSKLLGCFVAMLVGGLFVAAEPLLVLWLGSGAEVYVLLFRIMMIYLVFTIGEAVLWQIYTTLNKVHFTGIVSVTAGIINIVVSMLLIHAGFGAIGVAVGTAVASVLASALAVPLGVCREFKLPYKIVLWNYTCSAMMFLVSAVPVAVALHIEKTSVLGAVIIFTLLFSGGIFLAEKIILAPSERDLLATMVRKALGVLRGSNLRGL